MRRLDCGWRAWRAPALTSEPSAPSDLAREGGEGAPDCSRSSALGAAGGSSARPGRTTSPVGELALVVVPADGSRKLSIVLKEHHHYPRKAIKL